MAVKGEKEMEMVEVYIPREPGNDDQTVWVGLNGKGYSFPRGKRIKVPADVAEIMRQSEIAQDYADEFADREQQKAKEIVGA